MIDIIKDFIEDSKALLDFTRCMTMATGYKKNEFNFSKYFRMISRIEGAMKTEKSITRKILVEVVEEHFKNEKLEVKECIERVIKRLTLDEVIEAKKIFKGLDEVLNEVN